MTTRLWLVRHGETDWSAAGRLNGWCDVRLNQRGRDQARVVSGRLKRQHFITVWSSDLRRAAETARLAYGEPVVDARVRELDFGTLEGLTWGGLAKGVQDALVTFDDFEAPGGETIAMMRCRVLDLLGELGPGEHLVFTHGGVIRLLLRTMRMDREVKPGALVVLMLAQRARPRHPSTWTVR